MLGGGLPGVDPELRLFLLDVLIDVDVRFAYFGAVAVARYLDEALSSCGSTDVWVLASGHGCCSIKRAD